MRQKDSLEKTKRKVRKNKIRRTQEEQRTKLAGEDRRKRQATRQN